GRGGAPPLGASTLGAPAPGGTRAGGPTDGGTTDGGTTDGGTTDGGTTDGGTTDGGATTGGGTPPPACPAADDHWSVQWFDTIDLTYPRGVQEITDFEWLLDHGGGTPPGMNVTDDDKYSARFTRTANFQAIGTYRFHFQTNDGNRFFVNGTEVHEDWEGQGWSSGYSYVDVDITDGCNVDLMMEYYQNGGTSKLQFWYEPIDVAIQGTDSGSVPAGGHTGSTHPDWVGQSGEPIGNHPENDFCTTTQTNWTSDWGGGSWLAEYWNFDDSYWTGSYGLTLYAGDPDLAEHITNSAVDWGNSGPAGQNNYFAIRWTATINVPANCTFDVRGGGDDGFALYVDGLRVSENWANHATEFDPATVTLAEGQHLLVFEMYEWGGYADAYVEWKSS
ncbi:MAG: PA14 domain-containing protein, partial [Actinomycetota bacterium]